MNIKSISDDLRTRYDAVTRIIELCEKHLSGCPEGRLRIKRRMDTVYYCHVTDRNNLNGTPITGNIALVKALAQKEYLQSLLKIAQQEQAVLYQAIKGYPNPSVEDLYTTYSQNRMKLIAPIILPDNEYLKNWISKSYKPKPISDDIPIYLTMKGERVRSKSEQIIADHLNTNGIPYKYECPINFGDFIMHPDFTILRLSDRKEVYYEHFGRMDDPEYAENSVRKLTVYSLNGYTLGDNLFATFETRRQPLDIRVLEDLISKSFR